MASSSPQEAPIRDLCASAILSLGRLKEHAEKHAQEVENENIAPTIDDAIGRCQLWAGNLGAQQPRNSPKSLDFRLRDAPEIRQLVRQGLERLATAASTATAILEGSRPDRCAIEDEAGDDQAVTPVHELGQLLESIRSSINTLFRLSMLVRRHRPRGRHSTDAGSDDFPPGDPLDIRHVYDMFPRVKNTPWLADRLGSAISKRRDYIRGREKHRKSLAEASATEEDANADSGTVATTFVDDGVQQNNQDKACSVITSATSFLSVGDDGQAIVQAIPDLSDMIMDGVQLDYGEPFECPFCRTIQNASNRSEWKKHIFFDLQPYVCTFEGCSSGVFDSRHEWWQHELDTHRRKWRCTLCRPSSASTGSKQQIEAHLKTQHCDVVTEIQIPFVLTTCRDPTGIDVTTCPLCSDWSPRGERERWEGEFVRHLSRHMQQLALAALQVYIDGLVYVEQPVIPGPGDDSDTEALREGLPDGPEWMNRLPRLPEDPLIQDAPGKHGSGTVKPKPSSRLEETSPYLQIGRLNQLEFIDVTAVRDEPPFSSQEDEKFHSFKAALALEARHGFGMLRIFAIEAKVVRGRKCALIWVGSQADALMIHRELSKTGWRKLYRKELTICYHIEI